MSMLERSKKILFVTRSSAEGGEAVFINKLQSLLKDTFDIKICSFLPSQKNNNNNIIFLKPTFFLKKPILNFKSLAILAKEIKQVDIVEHFVFDIYSLPFFFLGQFYHKKNIVTFHTNFQSVSLFRKPYFFILKFLMINYFILFAEKAIFITNAQVSNFRKFCLFRKRFDRKSIFVYNFIEKELILSYVSQKEYNQNVLYVGRYTKAKGFIDLLKVAERTRNATFCLIGDNEFKSYLSNVKNLGKIDNSSVLKEYDKNSIFILPSYTEVFPMTILEAMARGLVVLVSDLPGMKEIIQEGRNGFLFKPGDVDKMEQLVSDLVANQDTIKSISENNIQDVKKFTVENQVIKYSKLYQNI